MWIYHLAAEAVDGTYVKRWRAQPLGPEFRSTKKAVTSKIQPTVQRQFGDNGLQLCGSRTVEFSTDVVVIEESDSDEAAFTARASNVSVHMNDGKTGPVSDELMSICERDRAAFEGAPLDNVQGINWNIRKCDPFCGRSKFLRCTISCM